MSLAPILAKLIETSARLQIRDGALHLSAPEHLVTREWMKQARAYRAELLDFLQQRGGHFHAAPLTRGQHALWSLYRLQPESPVYNLTIVFRLRQDLEISCLERALNALAARHAGT